MLSYPVAVLILASASPRRADLLAAAGYTFTIHPTDVDEQLLPGEPATDAVARLSRVKAAAVPAPAEVCVLAADTLVVLDDEALGKPGSAAEARDMLRRLLGRAHEVVTGVTCRRGPSLITEVVETRVWMAPLSDAQLDAYLATGEPLDKAGAYGIQGRASRFVTRVEGSYTNVVGLPVAVVARQLTRLGYPG
jgi:septum formation protein